VLSASRPHWLSILGSDYPVVVARQGESQVGAGALLTLYGRGAWAHDTNGFGTATVFFQSLPGIGFLVTAAKPDNNSALATAGAKYSLGNGWSLLAQFDGQFSGNTSIYAGTGTVRCTS
jgi:hypothetical protein